MQGPFKSIENKVSLGGPRDLPAHDPVGKCVDDEGDIHKALSCRDIAKVADPKQVRCRCPEPTVHLVART